MGKTVPWICWEEWITVRNWLLSQSREQIARGIRQVLVVCFGEWGLGRMTQKQSTRRHAVVLRHLLRRTPKQSQVEAWRARGRVPLGVDITASLLETALCDASFWGQHTAATAAGGSTGSVAVAGGGVSQQQLRLQYAATIVRCVVDSFQSSDTAL